MKRRATAQPACTFSLLRTERGGGKKKEHEPSTNRRRELRGHKWDMRCMWKKTHHAWNPPFVPARQIPEFNWITTNPIEPRNTSHPCIPECAEKAAVLLLFQSLGLFPPSSKSPKWGEKHGMRAQKPKQKPACGGVDRVSCDWEHLCFPPCDFIYFILLQPQIHSVGRYGSRHRALPKPAARSRPRRFQPGESRGKKWGWAAAANQSNFPSSAPRSEMEKPML